MLFIEKSLRQIQKELHQLTPIGLLVIIESRIGNMSTETCEKNNYLKLKRHVNFTVKNDKTSANLKFTAI
jgi:hypothetical protein